MSATGLIELVCPRCADPLPIVGEERIFACRGCATRWMAPESGSKGLIESVRTLVAPQQPLEEAAPLFYLPLWVIRVRTDEMGPVGERMPQEIRVPAFGLGRMPLVLQFARNLSRSPAVWHEWSGPELSIEPAELGASDAFSVAELVVLRHVEGWPGDDDLDVEIPLGSARLLDWPFTQRGMELIDLVAGLTLHSTALGPLQPADSRTCLIDLPQAVRTPAGE